MKMRPLGWSPKQCAGEPFYRRITTRKGAGGVSASHGGGLSRTTCSLFFGSFGLPDQEEYKFLLFKLPGPWIWLQEIYQIHTGPLSPFVWKREEGNPFILLKARDPVLQLPLHCACAECDPAHTSGSPPPTHLWTPGLRHLPLGQYSRKSKMFKCKWWAEEAIPEAWPFEGETGGRLGGS